MGIVNMEARNCNDFGYENYSNYFFQVARRPLNMHCGGCSATLNDNWMHHALFFDDEIFEFGLDGYQRRKFINCDDRDEYTMDDEIKGYSTTRPIELDIIIKNNGTFKSSDYNVINHNCHDFVLFCLKIIDTDAANKYKKKL